MTVKATCGGGALSNKRFQRTPVLARLTWRRCGEPLKRNMLERHWL
jgi:hypothetical protein